MTPMNDGARKLTERSNWSNGTINTVPMGGGQACSIYRMDCLKIGRHRSYWNIIMKANHSKHFTVSCLSSITSSTMSYYNRHITFGLILSSILLSLNFNLHCLFDAILFRSFHQCSQQPSIYVVADWESWWTYEGISG